MLALSRWTVRGHAGSREAECAHGSGVWHVCFCGRHLPASGDAHVSRAAGKDVGSRAVLV